MYNDKCKKDNASFKSNSAFSSSSSSKHLHDHSGVLCPEMETVNGTLLYRYMINVTFVDQFQQEISFDKNGDPPAWRENTFVGYLWSSYFSGMTFWTMWGKTFFDLLATFDKLAVGHISFEWAISQKCSMTKALCCLNQCAASPVVKGKGYVMNVKFLIKN